MKIVFNNATLEFRKFRFQILDHKENVTITNWTSPKLVRWLNKMELCKRNSIILITNWLISCKNLVYRSFIIKTKMNIKEKHLYKILDSVVEIFSYICGGKLSTILLSQPQTIFTLPIHRLDKMLSYIWLFSVFEV